MLELDVEKVDLRLGLVNDHKLLFVSPVLNNRDGLLHRILLECDRCGRSRLGLDSWRGEAPSLFPGWG